MRPTGATLPLVVPSGDDGGHSIEVHPDGDGDAYVLRPVVRVREAAITGACSSDAENENKQ